MGTGVGDIDKSARPDMGLTNEDWLVQAPSSCVSPALAAVSVLCNVKLRSAESSRRGFGPGGAGGWAGQFPLLPHFPH